MNTATTGQHMSRGGANSETHSVRTERCSPSHNLCKSAPKRVAGSLPRASKGAGNVTGLLNSDISHRVTRTKVSKLVIKCYKADVKIQFYTDYSDRARKGSRKRKEIYQLSDKSVRNLKFNLRNVMHLMDSISTVTYPDDFPWFGNVIKKHIDILGKRLARKGIMYVWVMEFQERGAGHFHIFTTKPVDRQWIAKAWYEIVDSGDKKHLQAGTSVQYIVEEDDPRLPSDRARYKAQRAKGNRNAKRNYISRSEAISYMVSYYKKESQKEVPFGFFKPGRFWSASRGLLQCSKKVVQGDIKDLKRDFRVVRRWYKAHLRALPKPIKWRPKSNRKRFLIWDGAKFFDYLDTLQHGKTSLTLEDAVVEKKKQNSTLEVCHEPL
jgi:hypothetical protein